MSPIRSAWKDYAEAARAFSRPARLYLLAEFLAWTGHGIYQVLFNLYLVEGGHSTAVVGRAISLMGVGLALAALPAGALANRWGRRPCIVLGLVLDAAGQILRVATPATPVIYGASLLAGAGQALLQISGAPFLTEHSSARERTHLFSAFFAVALLAGVIGSILGGWLPPAFLALPAAVRPDLHAAYRAALVLGALVSLAGLLPMLRLRGLVEAPHAGDSLRVLVAARRQVLPIGVNFLLIGAGAGLVIPFMNLYFAERFRCSSSQIGSFFSVAQVLTAIASLAGPAIARRYGKLRTATVAQLLSLPFLITLGAEHRLDVAVAAFWLRATFMQASSPLLGAFVMEVLPPALRAPATSLNHLLWNIGWSASATLAGWVILEFGYAVPFYVTAVLYAGAAVYFFLSFSRTRETGTAAAVAEAPQGVRGEGTPAE
jgi:MFS family permease